MPLGMPCPKRQHITIQTGVQVTTYTTFQSHSLINRNCWRRDRNRAMLTLARIHDRLCESKLLQFGFKHADPFFQGSITIFFVDGVLVSIAALVFFAHLAVNFHKWVVSAVEASTAI
ncbi:hypothetical protein R1flu_001701 [Riccia fluitans]|uniref:Uncharacterized protein n=1 Tax=Riccia fluitans TaxID=41844 RepID=A0ABD1Y4C1_9MARC